MLYDSIYMKCPKPAKPRRQKQISGCQVQGRGNSSQWTQVSFQGDENGLKLALMFAPSCDYMKTTNCMLQKSDFYDTPNYISNKTIMEV